MSAAVQRLKLRLFVEGVEIPCISTTVQSAPNSPLMASIQIIPLAEGTRFLPRTIVHVFFLDDYESAVPNLRSTTAAKEAGPSTFTAVNNRMAEKGQARGETLEATDNDINDYRLQKYKLLFAGELLGFQWSKSPTSRSLVLQCSDLSNYWDHAYQFNNSDLFGPGYKALFSGGSTNLFTDFLSSPGQIVTKILQTPSTRYPALKGLLGGIIHLLEAMGGSYYYGKKYAGQNLFFSLAELRLHISQHMTAFEKDPTSAKLMGGSYDSLFGRSIGSLGDQASFRTVVNKLISFIFHETYAQPCPMYSPGTGGTISGFTRKAASEIPELLNFLVQAAGVSDLLNETATDLDQGVPPQDIAQSRRLQLQAARSNCMQQARNAARISGQNKTTAKQIASTFSSVASRIGTALASFAKPSNAASILRKAATALNQLQKAEVQTNSAKTAIPASLKQQIFRPDVWFSAPPRCNVLFPDQYMQFNYARSFMAEPTRLMLKTHDEFFGEDQLFDNFYFAPKALTVKAEANTLRNILKNDVMDHELFTGIIPVFEKMGEFNIFAARDGKVDGKTPKVGLAQRTTNFLYFKYRFAARQAQVQARFNPYIACGFPGLVIDKYVDLRTLKLHNELKQQLPNGESHQSRLPPLLGTHFLGNFTEVSHTVDQRSGVTNITMTYARQADETVEFLGAEQEKATGVIKKKSEATRDSDVASVFPPRVGAMGPGQGRIVSVIDVTDKYVLDDGGGSKQLPLLGASRDKKTKQLNVKVPVGVRQPAKDYGDAVVQFAGDPGIFVEFRAFRVTETKQREVKETLFLPPEEYIRPGWYGDCWHPSKISEPYYEFFNTGAITEATQVQNTDGDPNTQPFGSNNAAEVLSDMANGDDLGLVRDQLIELSQTKDTNIADAVAFLVLTYSVIKQGQFDVNEFIRSYTWRPIATVLDMFGSNDLALSEDGTEVVRGFEGIHSRAFGDFENLFGLVPPDVVEVLGVKAGSAAAAKMDTRRRKRQAVWDYLAVLQLGKAILG